MEPEGSLPHSQEPATCPYPEPYQSSPCPPIPLLEDPFYAAVENNVSFQTFEDRSSTKNTEEMLNFRKSTFFSH
jgi:hypothetical protein